MCIRDSDCSACILTPLMVDVAQHPKITLRTSAEVTQVKGCLLYTSDAADERSSVDLGGRRIIKKKQTSEHIESIHHTH